MIPIHITVDHRYSADGIAPTPWESVREIFASSEIYALTTLLPDGMPHTVPISGILDDHGLLFCTGPNEQKARNIAHDPRGSVHIGSTHFFEGVDIVLRGAITRVTDQSTLQHLRDAFIAKYGEFWTFGVGEDALINHHELPAWVFRLVPEVGYSFTRGEQTAQTRYDFPEL